MLCLSVYVIVILRGTIALLAPISNIRSTVTSHMLTIDGNYSLKSSCILTCSLFWGANMCQMSCF